METERERESLLGYHTMQRASLEEIIAHTSLTQELARHLDEVVQRYSGVEVRCHCTASDFIAAATSFPRVVCFRENLKYLCK